MSAAGFTYPRVGGRVSRFGAAVLAALVWMTLPTGSTAERARVVSVLVRAVNPLAAREAVTRHHGTVDSELPIIESVTARVPASEVASLTADPAVAVVPNDAVHVQADAAPRTATAVFPQAVGADALYASGITGRGVTVAVVDTGIAKVSDLGRRVVGGVDLSGEANPYADSYGHGTFVAGVLAGDGRSSGGVNHGVAPGARLLAVKVAGRDGSTDLGKVVAGINWVIQTKALYNTRVLNLSLGADPRQSYLFSPLNLAVEKAWAAGIVVVVSASNGGPAAGTISKPGDDPFVITVGASDDHGSAGRADDTLAEFSGRGPTVADGLVKPDLVAPGRSVIGLRAPGSTIDTENAGARIDTAYFKGSGTSFSAGITSGAIALMLQRDSGLVPNLVKSRVMATAAGGLGDALSAGDGALDVAGAATSLLTTLANVGLPQSLGAMPPLPLALQQLLAQAGNNPARLDTLASQWAASQWGASQWAASQWGASQWAALRWAASQWAASQWGASQWAASQWAASQWAASQWAASQWSASQWSASQWAASQWAASQWAASQWSGSQWAGSQWSASQWSGSQWAASQWYASQWS